MEETYTDSDGQILRLYIDLINTKWHYNSNGYLHRLDGPAVEWIDGAYSWRINGHSHRIGGPSFFDPTDKKNIEWQINGKCVMVYYIYG